MASLDGLPELMRPVEVARILRVSTMTIYRMAASGKLPKIFVGNSNQFRIPREAVRQMMQYPSVAHRAESDS